MFVTYLLHKLTYNTINLKTLNFCGGFFVFMVMRLIFKERFKLHDSVMKTIFWPEKLIYLKMFGINVLYYV